MRQRKSHLRRPMWRWATSHPPIQSLLHDPKAESKFNKSLNCTHPSKSESDGKPTTQVWLWSSQTVPTPQKLEGSGHGVCAEAQTGNHSNETSHACLHLPLMIRRYENLSGQGIRIQPARDQGNANSYLTSDKPKQPSPPSMFPRTSWPLFRRAHSRSSQNACSSSEMEWTTRM